MANLEIISHEQLRELERFTLDKTIFRHLKQCLEETTELLCSLEDRTTTRNRTDVQRLEETNFSLFYGRRNSDGRGFLENTLHNSVTCLLMALRQKGEDRQGH